MGRATIKTVILYRCAAPIKEIDFVLNPTPAPVSPSSTFPTPPPTNHADLLAWVQTCAELCKPERVHWCDGTQSEYDRLIAGMVETGVLVPLNQTEYPGCYLHRSHPNDVARVENATFICSDAEADAGPTNHWMSPEVARETLTPLYDSCMAGRTLYVLPYVMGPLGSPLSEVGVEITDSPYVAASMRIMTRMGSAALTQLGQSGAFVKGLHSMGDLSPDRRYICHFPETRTIWSFGSNYGGNALLGKKCHALRIASATAKSENWMAEHMMLLELSAPDGNQTYFAGAFPSACGKTNLAMLVSPLEQYGYTVRTIGDDIAWMRVGPDGRLWAINPEAGFFGVAPGTSSKTNPNALATIHQNTIFTNVAVSDNGLPWWEGMDGDNAPCPYEFVTDWKGVRRKPSESTEPLAHPNSRFTAPAKNCPSMSAQWEDPNGVPISGILFGGRRNNTVPLITEATNWQHGVFMGATMGSRTTAAAAGQTGVLRRDPMAMLPFCGYHMGDYFAHWLHMGQIIPHPPRIFAVNWFRRDTQNHFLWPGFGENIRVLIWAMERIHGRGIAQQTPIGLTPTNAALPLQNLVIEPARIWESLLVNRAEWRREVNEIASHFARFGDRLPSEMAEEMEALRARLG